MESNGKGPSAAEKAPSADEVAERVREICRRGGLREPDEVVDRIAERGEVVCLWVAEELAIVVEVSS